MLQKIVQLLLKTTPSLSFKIFYQSEISTTFIITEGELDSLDSCWVYTIVDNDSSSPIDDVYKVVIPSTHVPSYEFIEKLIYNLRVPVTITNVTGDHVKKLLGINE